ncbi:phosphotransferase [Iamia sp. SCSIO 61187]|uniref:phosphotransferase n=1 Tax=Iamia sp. SCSIO 61187 TaxID=2722752 RepID=UPI001C6331D6|nr:phosphotransferase [Iamia sp. SCSIO 61187]QYG93076.1 phosphotransferase [Iamia sp. SCSIO 61187]
MSPPEPRFAGADAATWCREHLGAEVATVLWSEESSGLVVAVDLADGRAVVVKVRPGEQAARVAESRAVQAALADAGFPVPRPVGALHPWGSAVAGAEVRVDGGAPIDARTAEGRATTARLLRELVVAATEVAPARVALHEPWGIALPAAALWPDPPHDPRFDLTLAGGEWIDDLAVGLRRRLVRAAAGAPRVVGHVDWRAEHIHVDATGRVLAVFDWDALVRAPEAVLVGQAAAGFTVVWGTPDPHPTIAEGRAFLAAYGEARGAALTAAERELADAAHGYVVAYGARCEHSDQVTGLATPGTGWRRLLRARETADLR